MAKENNTLPTLNKEIAGLLKEKEFVLHCIDIKSSTEYFNNLNALFLAHVTDHANQIENETERNDFLATMRQHFHEIKLLRELYDNLKN